MNDVINVGQRQIGPGNPTFIAAEVGINHNGDLEIAHQMIDAASAAGADGVKFQNFRAEDFIADDSLRYEYTSEGESIVESQLEMFKRYELDPRWLPELKQHCDDLGVVFFSTPTSAAGIAQLVELEVRLLKNGSDYLGNLELIRAMAASGIPTVLSTGMASLEEVDDAVAAFRDEGGTHLVLLQCTSSYPTPPDEMHVRKMATLRDRFDCLVGLSDHSEGIEASIAAVALDGCFIEKHFTLDRGMAGPDHRFSIDPSEWKGLVHAIRECEAVLGSPEVEPAAIERDARRDYRLSCVASRDLEPGHVLSKEDVAFKRPGSGIPPKEAPTLVGRVVRQRVTKGHVFVPDELD